MLRAVLLRGEQDDALLAAAMAAPTLLQRGVRTEHADLLPRFADELRAFRSAYQLLGRWDWGWAPDHTDGMTRALAHDEPTVDLDVAGAHRRGSPKPERWGCPCSRSARSCSWIRSARI